MSGHTPTVLHSRRASWATCSCGWKSALYRTARFASVAWADHIRDRVARKSGAVEVGGVGEQPENGGDGG